MYKIWIIKSAQKDINSLPKAYISTIVKKIQDLAQNPRPNQSKKLRGSKDVYRIRTGDYRILYTIEDKTLQIIIYKVDHRKDIYR